MTHADIVAAERRSMKERVGDSIINIYLLILTGGCLFELIGLCVLNGQLPPALNADILKERMMWRSVLDGFYRIWFSAVSGLFSGIAVLELFGLTAMRVRHRLIWCGAALTLILAALTAVCWIDPANRADYAVYIWEPAFVLAVLTGLILLRSGCLALLQRRKALG